MHWLWSQLRKSFFLHKLRNWKHGYRETARVLLSLLVRSVSTIGSLKGENKAVKVWNGCDWSVERYLLVWFSWIVLKPAGQNLLPLTAAFPIIAQLSVRGQKDGVWVSGLIVLISSTLETHLNLESRCQFLPNLHKMSVHVYWDDDVVFILLLNVYGIDWFMNITILASLE